MKKLPSHTAYSKSIRVSDHITSSKIFLSALFLTMFVLLVPSHLQAKTIEGIKLKDSIKLGEEQLLLNGVGKRSKYFIDLYIAALYLAEKSQDAESIIESKQTMLIQIHVISDLITSENLIRGTTEGFNKATNNQTEAIQTQIDDFLEAFKAPIKKGDFFDIVYQAGIGVTVLKNRKITKQLPENLAFKQALFGIWLSNKPAQESLKDSLLGR